MLSILFATRNGAPTLPRVLSAYEALQAPKGGWKVIIVNNNSDDETAAILDSYKNRLPLTVIDQPKPGKNRALNLGLTAAEGDLVVLTDDDAVPEADWLQRWRQVADSTAEADLFGGRVLPLWPEPPPDWILNAVPLQATYAISRDTLADGPVISSQIFGPNMAVRRTVFDAGHRFDEAVGPAPGQYRMGSETEFTRRLTQAGYKPWFSNAPRVGHIIRPWQMDRDWIIKRSARLGRGVCYRDSGQDPAKTPLLFGVPRWRLRGLLEEMGKWATSTLRADRTAAFAARLEIAFLMGYFAEVRAMQKQAAAPTPAPAKPKM
ncbi:MAG: glycosyltransferase [Magnetospiraceae bacterium]